MELHSSSYYRLYDVAASVDENGAYALQAFDDVAFNEVVDADELYEMLGELADSRFGQSRCRFFEVTNDTDIVPENGKLRFDVDDGQLEIRDIVDRIDVDPEESRFFIIVDAKCSEYGWVVATPQGNVYSG